MRLASHQTGKVFLVLPPTFINNILTQDLHEDRNLKKKKTLQRITSESPGDVFELGDSDMAAATIG